MSHFPQTAGDFAVSGPYQSRIGSDAQLPLFGNLARPGEFPGTTSPSRVFAFQTPQLLETVQGLESL